MTSPISTSQSPTVSTSQSPTVSTSPTNISQVPYWMKVGKEGENRLTLQCEILNPKTLELLDSLNLTNESRVLDMGSGTGSISCAIASKYGCSVLGLDISEEQIEIAREAASSANISNLVNFEQCLGSHLSANYQEQFDVVMCRLFLCHLERPEEVLMQMAERVKPGGFLVCEDLECGWETERYSCSPTHYSYDFWVKIGKLYEQIQGTDFNIGSKFPDLINSQEFKVIINQSYQKQLETSHEKSIFRLGLMELASKFLERGSITQDETDNAMEGFRDLENGEYTASYFPMVQFVAQKNINFDS